MEKLTKEGFLTSIFNYEKKSEWEYQGEKPCLIEFHDDSCPPCQALGPVLDELSELYENRILFYRVDMSEEAELADELGIKNLPTIVLCPVGDKPIVFQGATSEEKLRPILEEELLGGLSEPDGDHTKE